jgi:hypothetical protein
MIRALLAVAAIVGAAIGTTTTVGSTGSAKSPVIFTASCPQGGYAPLDVHCNPRTPLPGDTYQCRDGCFSDSKTSQGACSHHGGIDHPVNQGNG